MVGEACLPSNAYYPRTPDYTLCSGVHVCRSEHSDSSFVYGFMILNYGFGTMTATTLLVCLFVLLISGVPIYCIFQAIYMIWVSIYFIFEVIILVMAGVSVYCIFQLIYILYDSRILYVSCNLFCL